MAHVRTRDRLGAGFTRLWAAAACSGLADGIGRIAVPLIATTLTSDPFAISLVTASAFVPWLLFGLPAGVIVDRCDRRRVMAAADALRTLAALVLAVLATTGVLELCMVLVGVVAFGVGETLFDNATNAAIPGLVTRSRLDRANGRIQAAQVAVDSFVAAPIGGVLFAVALALPLWIGAAGYLVPIVLVLLLPRSAARPAGRSMPVAAPPDPSVIAPEGAVLATLGEAPVADAPPSGRAGDAVRFLGRHRYLRGMVLFSTVLGAALQFAQAALILFLLDGLHVAAGAIGLVTAGLGAGALIGALSASRLVARFGRGRVMVATAFAAGAAVIATGLLPEVWGSTTAFALSALAISVWNVPWGALRQQIVPEPLFGRVLGINRTVSWGLLPVATLLGGWVSRIDLRLPFVVGGAVMVLATALAVPLLVRGTREAGAEAPTDREPPVAA